LSETSSVTEPTVSAAGQIARKFGQKFIILHYSPFKAVWDWIVLLLVLYTAIVTPYTAAFLLNEDEKRAKLNQNAATRLLNSERTGAHPLVILDLIVDIMFLVDIIISFRYVYIFIATRRSSIQVSYFWAPSVIWCLRIIFFSRK
jgi:hypothetical protein